MVRGIFILLLLFSPSVRGVHGEGEGGGNPSKFYFPTFPPHFFTAGLFAPKINSLLILFIIAGNALNTF